MSWNRTRRLVLAFSLVAVVGAMLPGSHAASAAPDPAASASEARVQYEQAPPKPVLTHNKMAITLGGETHFGKITHYHFQIHAVSGTLQDVSVEMASRYAKISDPSVGGNSGIVTQNLGTFSAPDVRFVTVTCTPPAGMYCDKAWVGASSSSSASVGLWNEADGF
jgi:hypothetical protein